MIKNSIQADLSNLQVAEFQETLSSSCLRRFRVDSRISSKINKHTCCTDTSELFRKTAAGTSKRRCNLNVIAKAVVDFDFDKKLGGQQLTVNSRFSGIR